MDAQNAQINDLRKALSDSTVWSLVSLFLILITLFVWLISRSQPDPHASSSVLSAVQQAFGDKPDARIQSDPEGRLREAAQLLLAAGGQASGLRDDVPGDVRVAFNGGAMFEDGSSALTAEGRTAVQAIAGAVRQGGTLVRADVLVPPQGNVLTALDSVRIAVLASTLESMGAPMGQVRLGLAADHADGLVVGLGVVHEAGSTR